VFIGIAVIFLIFSTPVDASPACDVTLQNSPFPPTIRLVFEELSNHCPNFPFGYVTYGVIAYQKIGQEKAPLFSVENNDLMGIFVPPLKIFYKNEESPIEIHVGPKDITTEDAFPLQVTTTKWNINVDNICFYREVIVEGRTYWEVKSKSSEDKELCNFLLME